MTIHALTAPDSLAAFGRSLYTAQEDAPLIPNLEYLLLGCLSMSRPTSLEQAVTKLCEKHPDLAEALSEGAPLPHKAGAQAQRVWRTLQQEGWARLYRTAGLVLTREGEQRLDVLWSRKEQVRG